MNVLIYFFQFYHDKNFPFQKLWMQWFSYTINLVRHPYLRFCHLLLCRWKKSENSKGKHTVLISLSTKLQVQMCIQNPSNSSTNPQSPYYSWATPQYQAHQLLLKLITCNMFVYSLSYNIPFFLLTTIHLIFFAKLKSSIQPH